MHLPIQTTLQVSMELVKYWQAQNTFMLARDVQYLSLATDKTRILGLSIESTAVADPKNQAMWCFPVVDLCLRKVGRCNMSFAGLPIVLRHSLRDRTPQSERRSVLLSQWLPVHSHRR